jgi:hypothetical protein
MSYIDSNGIYTATELADKLSADYHIKCRVDVNSDGLKLYTFNYDQINSPKMEPIVQACRGLVLKENLDVAAYCLPRFFNLGEALDVTDQFVWDKPFTVQEKADGSLIKIYNVNNHWEIGTRGTATAEVPNYTGQLFRDMVIKAMGFSCEKAFQRYAKLYFQHYYTYILEFISPDNRVVTPYTKAELVLLDVLGNDGKSVPFTEIEEEYVILREINIRPLKTYRLSTRKDVVQRVNTLSELQEGFVLRDVNGLRIKVKSETYVAVHKLRGDSIPTPKRIAELVVTNETEEYLAYFPEERERFTKYLRKWEIITSVAEDQFNHANQLANQKDFALEIRGCLLLPAMFTARTKNTSFSEALADLRTKIKVDTLLSLITV